MFILKKGHQPGVYVPLMALFLVFFAWPFGIGGKFLRNQKIIIFYFYRFRHVF